MIRVDGRKWNTPSQNIVVRGCQMRDGHGGVVVGSEISGGYRNLYVEDCVMDSPNLDRVIRIKTNSCRGGIIENIFVRNVHLENVTCQKSQYGVFLNGLDDECNIYDVTVKNCEWNGVTKGKNGDEDINYVIGQMRDIVFDNHKINGELVPSL